MSRISNGWKLTMNSFKVLSNNKQLLMFPILSGLSMILLTGSFVFAAVFAGDWFRDAFENRSFYYLTIFGFYLINYFVVVFFNVALMHCVRLYFAGEDADLGAGLKFSCSRIGTIVGWSVLAATVGSILKVVQQETGLVGKIITGIIGVVWNVATFFVVPVLAYEGAGPLEAVKRSSQIMKEKWGESLAGNFSFGLVQFLAIIVTGVPLYFLGAMIHPFAGIMLAVMAVMVIAAIMSAAQAIFISSVYHQVTGHPVTGMDADMVDELFATKESKKWW